MSRADEKPVKATGRKSRALVIAPEAFDPRLHNGEITVVRNSTGSHHTYRITTVKKGSLEGKRILASREGSRYTGFAFVDDDGQVTTWSRFRPESVGSDFYVRSAWIFTNIARYIAKGFVTVHVSGRCRRCDRILTHPDSIASGLGPDCRAIAGM